MATITVHREYGGPLVVRMKVFVDDVLVAKLGSERTQTADPTRLDGAERLDPSRLRLWRAVLLGILLVPVVRWTYECLALLAS